MINTSFDSAGGEGVIFRLSEDENRAFQDRMVSLGFRLPYTPAFSDFQDYHRRMRTQFVSAMSLLPLSPEQIQKTLLKGLVGGVDELRVHDMEVSCEASEGQVTSLEIKLKMLPPGLDHYDTSFRRLCVDTKFDFTTGRCFANELRIDLLKQKGIGRMARRNAIEVGYALGCSTVEIQAAKIGASLWLQGGAYDVVSINPKYLGKIESRWATIRDHIDPDLAQHIDMAMGAANPLQGRQWAP